MIMDTIPVEIKRRFRAQAMHGLNVRFVAIFQPHRYTRVRDLFDDFCRAFYSAHTVVVCPVYRAGEKTNEGIDNHALARQMRAFGHSNIRYVKTSIPFLS